MPNSMRLPVDNSCCFRQLNDGSTRMVYEITRKCNLHCIHCMAPPENYGSGLSHNRIIELMHELPSNSISKIMFTGGEPLLIPEIVEYVAIAAKYGIVVDINTNLTLLTRDLAHRLSDAGVTEVTTSIDGDRNTHCYIRGNNECYDKTLNAITMLRDVNIKVDVVSMVLDATSSKLYDVVQTVKKLDVSSLTFSGLIITGKAKKEQEAKDRQQIKKMINALREETEIPIRTVKLLSNNYDVCHKGIDMVSIDHCGNVHPCLQNKMTNPLNLESTSLKDAIAHMRRNITNSSCDRR